MSNSQSFLVGVDIGGTFTDLVGFDLQSGEVRVSKSRSTPRELSGGIMDCIGKSGIGMPAMQALFHGSTVVINAIIERKGAKVGLVTTRGFRDVLEIGRGNRPANYDLAYTKPEPFVPRELRFEVSERLSNEGEVLTPLSRDDLARIVAEVKTRKLEALAICFLHSYANARHEDEARDYLQRELPGLYVCNSAEVAREWREFERSSTTVLNAFVGPKVESYLGHLEKVARDQAFAGRFYLMQSSGGVMTVERAKRYPVAMVESGPVAGMIGAAHVGAMVGARLVIGFDMGGTTAKCSLVEDGVPKIIQTYYVNGYVNGYPLQVPTIEVIEVGTGGGSLAWIDDLGALKVGPRSAGSEPGPVCFGSGGVEPTVTDANVVLGRINPSRYLGGEMNLDVAGARKAINEKVGKPLGLGEDTAAAGIVTIANSNMALAVRGITIEKGVDPREATMVAFGGGGPLQAAAIARDIGIPRVIIPTLPSCFSALGMLLADVRHDLVRTLVRPFPGAHLEELNKVLGELRVEARERLAQSGTRAEDGEYQAFLDLRYAGQQWTLTVPVPGDKVTENNAPGLRAEFNRLYEARFGHSFDRIPAEVVNARIVARARQAKPEFAKLAKRKGKKPLLDALRAADAGAVEMRRVHFDGLGFVACPSVRREALLWGDRITGPALVEEANSTTVVGPGDVLEVDEHGFLIIKINTSRS